MRAPAQIGILERPAPGRIRRKRRNKDVIAIRRCRVQLLPGEVRYSPQSAAKSCRSLSKL